MKGDHLFSAKCYDAGFDCLFIAQGRTSDEAKRILMRHISRDHTEEVLAQGGDLTAIERNVGIA